MKALKIVLGVILVLVLIAAIGGFFLYKNLDGIVERAIENMGSDVTQTEVAVDGVKLELTEGRGQITGLSVANPQGFSNEKALTLGTVALQIKPSTVRDEVIVLDEVLIDSAKLRMEHQGLSDTNIKALMDNIRASTASQEPAAKDTAGPEQRFAVKSLKFKNISMDVVSEQIENRTLALKDIERSNLGSAEQGLTAKELALAIAQPVIDQARDRFEQEVKGRAQDELKEKIEDKLSDEDKEKVNRLKSILK